MNNPNGLQLINGGKKQAAPGKELLEHSLLIGYKKTNSNLLILIPDSIRLVEEMTEKSVS